MAMMAMDGTPVMVMVMAMDGTMATAMEGGTAKQRQQQGWMVQQQCNGKDGNGQGDGNGNGRRVGDAMATTAMDSARAMAIDGARAMQLQRNVQWQCNGNGRPVVVTDIKIKEEEIAHE